MNRPSSNRKALYFASSSLPGLDRGTRTLKAWRCSKPVFPKPCPHLWHSNLTKMPLWIHHHAIDEGWKTVVQKFCSCDGSNDKRKKDGLNFYFRARTVLIKCMYFFVADGKIIVIIFKNVYYSTNVVRISCKGHIFFQQQHQQWRNKHTLETCTMIFCLHDF